MTSVTLVLNEPGRLNRANSHRRRNLNLCRSPFLEQLNIKVCVDTPSYIVSFDACAGLAERGAPGIGHRQYIATVRPIHISFLSPPSVYATSSFRKVVIIWEHRFNWENS